MIYLNLCFMQLLQLLPVSFGALTIGLLPFFESAFGILSDMRLN